MGVNKVEYGSSTLVDLTGDTVTPETLLQGETAHNAAGNRITGTARPGVQTFNGRSGSVLPIAGDYSADQVNYDSNKTVKQVIDALATKEASDIAGQQSLLKDTVGWTGKNLLKNEATTQTINGVTFTVNADGSVTANGTATSDATFVVNDNFVIPEDDYILSSHETSDGNNIHYSVVKMPGNTVLKEVKGTDEQKFTVNYSGYSYLKFTVWVRSGTTVSNKTAYPMIRRADITDPTYEPYHESVEVMYEEEIHGVNLFSNSISGLATSGGAVGATNFSLAEGATAFYGKVQRNKNYTITKAGGDRFRVCLSNEVPAHRVPCNIIANADGNSYTFNSGNYDYVYLLASMTSQTIDVIKPMLRKANIEDSTYRPYNHQAIQNQLNAQGVLGAKNLLPYTRDSSTYTQSGVTYTRNADGSITANGNATANSFLPIAERLKYPINNLKKGVEYILSGDYGLGSGNGYVYVNFYNGSTRLGGVSTAGTGSVKFVIPESLNGTVVDGIDFGIGVLNGKTVNNFTFYPMLRLASDPDDTYQPYAMTNRELTDRIKTIVSEAVTEAFSANSTNWHNNANDCNVGFERTNDYRTSNMPTTGTASASVWYNIMTVRESNVSTSALFGYGFQIAVQTTSNSAMGDTYVRAVNGGATPTWSEWKKLN